MTNINEDAIDMINDLQEHESRLSEWELQFVEHLDHLIGGGKVLTERQFEKLDELWNIRILEGVPAS